MQLTLFHLTKRKIDQPDAKNDTIPGVSEVSCEPDVRHILVNAAEGAISSSPPSSSSLSSSSSSTHAAAGIHFLSGSDVTSAVAPETHQDIAVNLSTY